MKEKKELKKKDGGKDSKFKSSPCKKLSSSGGESSK